jgi:hypothetical protein
MMAAIPLARRDHAAGLNMSVALRRSEPRYRGYGDDGFLVSDAGISLLAALPGMPCLTDTAAFPRGHFPALAGRR